MVTNFEQYIYNSYLKSLRISQNKPYKLKKNFDDISEEKAYALKKLSIFLNSHKEIKPEEFFLASFKLYPDEEFFDLKYFTTLKAIKAFTVYQKNKEVLEPDSEEQISFTKESLIFINNFCCLNKIPFTNYLQHKTEKLPTFILHLKERKINIYSVIWFNDFEKLFKSVDYDILKFMFNETLLNNINTFKVKFLNSKRCKQLVYRVADFLRKKA